MTEIVDEAVNGVEIINEVETTLETQDVIVTVVDEVWYEEVSKLMHMSNILALPDNIMRNKLYNSERQMIVTLFTTELTNALCDDIDITDINIQHCIQNLAIRIEISCWVAGFRTILKNRLDSDNQKLCTAYALNYNRVLSNIELTPGFAKLLYNDIKLADNVGSMTSIRINPSKTDTIRKEMRDRIYNWVEEKVSTLHTCPRCYAKRTHVTPKQLRRGDEAMNYIIECIDCGKKWVI